MRTTPCARVEVELSQTADCVDCALRQVDQEQRTRHMLTRIRRTPERERPIEHGNPIVSIGTGRQGATKRHPPRLIPTQPRPPAPLKRQPHPDRRTRIRSVPHHTRTQTPLPAPHPLTIRARAQTTTPMPREQLQRQHHPTTRALPQLLIGDHATMVATAQDEAYPCATFNPTRLGLGSTAGPSHVTWLGLTFRCALAAHRFLWRPPADTPSPPAQNRLSGFRAIGAGLAETSTIGGGLR